MSFKPLHAAFAVFVAALIPAGVALAANSCEAYKPDAANCSVCLDGGALEVGNTNGRALEFKFTNTTDHDIALYRDDGLRLGMVPLQRDIQVASSSSFSVAWPPSIPFFVGERGREVTILLRGDSFVIRHQAGDIVFANANARANLSHPALKLEYTVKSHSYDFTTKAVGIAESETQCLFVGANR